MTFNTSARATAKALQAQTSKLGTSVIARRGDSLIKGLRQLLAAQEVEDAGTAAARIYGYGLTQVETTRIFREVDGQGRLHLVDVIAADEIDGVHAYVVDGIVIYPGEFPGQIRGEFGQIESGRFSGTGALGNKPPVGSRIILRNGAPGQTAIDPFVDETAATSSFVGTGLAYVYSRWVFLEGKFDGDPEVQVIARMRKPFDPRGGTQRWTFNPYVHLYDILIKDRSIGGAGIDEDLVDTNSFTFWADRAEEAIDIAPSTATAILTLDSNKSLSNHTLEFEAPVAPYQYGDIVEVVQAIGQSMPPNFSPGVRYHVMPIRHRFNDFQVPAIALAATIEDALAGNFLKAGTRLSEINIKKVQEVRYMSGFSYGSNESPLSVVQDMLASCGASIFVRDGKITVKGQLFSDTIETVTEDDVIDSSIVLSNRLPSADRATSFTGTFTSLVNLFEPKDYPTRDGGGIFQEADGGKALPVRFDLPFVGKVSVAQRLATVALRRLRQERVLTFAGGLGLYRLQPGTVFSLHHENFGLDADTTWEVRDHTLFIIAGNGTPEIGIDIVARQLEVGTFDLSLSDEELVASIDIPGIDSPFDVATPGDPTVTEDLFVTTGGAGVKARATVQWTASSGGFISGYRVSYKLASESALTTLPDTTETQIRILDIAPGVYDFRVVAFNTLGGVSDPAEVQKEIVAFSSPPSDPAGFNGQVVGSGAIVLTWDVSPDLDVTQGGKVEIRHHADIEGSLGADSTLLASQSGDSALAQVPFKRGTYYIRFVDQSGNASGFAEFSTDNRRPVPFAQVISAGAFSPNDSTEDEVTIQEDPTFPSANVENTLVEDVGNQWLELPAAGSFDDIANFDEVDNLDEVNATGAVQSEGVYFFSTGIALAAVTRMLVETVLETEVVDESTSIDSIENWDDIENLDAVGANASQPGQADAWMEYRSTRDDPLASPVFGPWQRIDTDILNHRGVEFRIQARSFAPTVNIRIKQARVLVRELPVNF